MAKQLELIKEFEESVKFKEEDKWREDMGRGFTESEVVKVTKKEGVIDVYLFCDVIHVKKLNDSRCGLSLPDTREVLEFLKKEE